MAAIGALTSFGPGAAGNGALTQPAASGQGQTASPEAPAVRGAPAPSLEAVLGALLAAANGKGDGLASLIADLKSLMAVKAEMPAALREATKTVLAFNADAKDARVDAAAIKAAA